LVILFLKYF